MAAAKKTETKAPAVQEAKAPEAEVKEVKAAAPATKEDKAPEVKEDAPKKAATARKAAAPKKEAEPKKAPARRTAPKKEAEPKAAAEPKKAPARKAPVKKAVKAETQATVYVQYAGNERAINDLVAEAKAAYLAAGHKEEDIKTLDVYVKPEESAAYYVVNGVGSEDYKIVF